MKNIYDNKDFFDNYEKMRDTRNNANDLIENPIILSMMPKVKDKKILDLGCGDGRLDEVLVKSGAKQIVGVDISNNMLKLASQRNLRNCKFLLMPMEEISKIDEKFDIVYSSLAIHYVEDFDKLLKDVYALLKKDGIFLFSIESPLNTALILEDNNIENKVNISGKNYYLLSDYCNEGERKVEWGEFYFTKYHRTYATMVNSIIKNHFDIIEIRDSSVSKQTIEICPKYKNQLDRPYFTFFKLKKKVCKNKKQK